MDYHYNWLLLQPSYSPWTLSGTTRVSQYQKGKTNLDLLEQETVSGSGISWAICKSAARLRQITMPASQHSVFYMPDALPAAQPTASKQWRQSYTTDYLIINIINISDNDCYSHRNGLPFDKFWFGCHQVAPTIIQSQPTWTFNCYHLQSTSIISCTPKADIQVLFTSLFSMLSFHSWSLL